MDNSLLEICTFLAVADASLFSHDGQNYQRSAHYARNMENSSLGICTFLTVIRRIVVHFNNLGISGKASAESPNARNDAQDEGENPPVPTAVSIAHIAACTLDLSGG